MINANYEKDVIFFTVDSDIMSEALGCLDIIP